MSEGKLLSIVIPVYNEGNAIYNNIKTVIGVLCENEIEHEVILVDDGSKDNTWEQLCFLRKDFEAVRALRLSRNFGKEAALCAGIEAVKGDACLIMDSDLQHPPRYIPEFYRLWQQGADVVDGVKKSRGKESAFSKVTAKLFYKLMHGFSGFDMHGASDFKLMSRKVIEAYNSLDEKNTFFRGMSAWLGFNRVELEFEVDERSEGKTKWSPLKLAKLALNAVTSFSSLPLYFVVWLGVAFLIAALALGIQTLVMYFTHQAVSGFTTVILLLLLTGSALMISLGIIGVYISKIYDEVKGRPRYIISEKR